VALPTRPYPIKNETTHFGLPPTSGVGRERKRQNSITGYGAGYVSGFSRYKELGERTQDKNIADSTAVALEDSLAQGPVLVQCHLLVTTMYLGTS
jgi:hypothetical protein